MSKLTNKTKLQHMTVGDVIVLDEFVAEFKRQHPEQDPEKYLKDHAHQEMQILIGAAFSWALSQRGIEFWYRIARS